MMSSVQLEKLSISGAVNEETITYVKVLEHFQNQRLWEC